MPTADMYSVWKDSLGTAIDWDAGGNRLYAFLMADSFTAINDAATDMSHASISGARYGGSAGISAVITGLSASGGVYTSSGDAVWSAPPADSGNTKHILLGWDTGSDPTTAANVIPIGLLSKAFIPDGSQYTLSPHATDGWFNLNAGV